MADTTEHALTFAVWPGFELPELAGAGDGVVAAPPVQQRLEWTYYDTPDLRLARAGVTLRHRAGNGEVWTVKARGRLSRAGVLEWSGLGQPGSGAAVPAEVAGLVRVYARTAPLVPVAHLVTIRHATELHDADGRTVAEVNDDEVSIMDGTHVAARFREVEAKARIDDRRLLRRVAERLRSAGAGDPDPVPKVMRALGPHALEAPDLVPVTADAESTTGRLLRAVLAAAVLRLAEHDPLIRIDGSVEAVHQARVATRRLRSTLRTFQPLLDSDWAPDLAAELRWLAGALGAVRDADVLRERLARQLAELPEEDNVAGKALLARVDDQRAEAYAQLLVVLDSGRYAALLESLVDATRHPRLRSRKGRTLAADILPAMARTPYRRYVRAVERLGPDPADEQLHRVRVRAKRARYAADVIEAVIGKPARRLSGALAAVQGELGEHQDAVVAQRWLRVAAAEVPSPVAFVAGQLVIRQQSDALARRATWLDAHAAVLDAGKRLWSS